VPIATPKGVILGVISFASITLRGVEARQLTSASIDSPERSATVSQPTDVSTYFAGIARGWNYDGFGNLKADTQGAISGATAQAAMPSSSGTYNTNNQLVVASPWKRWQARSGTGKRRGAAAGRRAREQ
jgi:hypothetical protein